MLIAIKWLIVITVYWVVFFWGGRKMQKRVRNSRNFTPGGGKCSNPVPQCLGNLLNSPGSSVLGKSLGEIY
uniref:Uncharacterized protein n=1 Tax=Human herpesvirus 2 TaxID=10310 RepID=A0A481TDV1_HHV2|nr:hypothetical protein [Human alphaherpesvirus 2]